MVSLGADCSRLLTLPASDFFLFGMRGVGKRTWARRVLPEARRFDLLDEGLYQAGAGRADSLLHGCSTRSWLGGRRNGAAPHPSGTANLCPST
jgi:hypothetical protein